MAFSLRDSLEAYRLNSIPWCPIPYHYLYTVILVISFIGGYGISNTMFNIYVMLALCLLSRM